MTLLSHFLSLAPSLGHPCFPLPSTHAPCFFMRLSPCLCSLGKTLRSPPLPSVWSSSNPTLYIIFKPFKLIWNFPVQTKDGSLAEHTCKICHLHVPRVRALGPALNALKSKHEAWWGIYLSPSFLWHPGKDVSAHTCRLVMEAIRVRGHSAAQSISLPLCTQVPLAVG